MDSPPRQPQEQDEWEKEFKDPPLVREFPEIEDAWDLILTIRPSSPEELIIHIRDLVFSLAAVLSVNPNILGNPLKKVLGDRVASLAASEDPKARALVGALRNFTELLATVLGQELVPSAGRVDLITYLTSIGVNRRAKNAIQNLIMGQNSVRFSTDNEYCLFHMHVAFDHGGKVDLQRLSDGRHKYGSSTLAGNGTIEHIQEVFIREKIMSEDGRWTDEFLARVKAERGE